MEEAQFTRTVGPGTAQIVIDQESSSHHVEHVVQTARLWLQAV